MCFMYSEFVFVFVCDRERERERWSGVQRLL